MTPSATNTSAPGHRFSQSVAAAWIAIAFLFMAVSRQVQAQDPARQARMAAAGGVESMLQGSGDESLRLFIAEHLADSYRRSLSENELLTHLRRLREATQGASDLDLQRIPQGLALVFSGRQQARIPVHLEAEAPWKIVLLGLEISDGTPRTAEDFQRVRIRALEGLATNGGDASLNAFAAEHLSPRLTSSRPEEDLLDLLRHIRRIGASAGSIMVEGSPEGLRLAFRGAENADILVGLEDSLPHRIVSLRIDTDVLPEGADEEPIEPFTWETLEARLAEAEQQGFAGTVLVVRDGKQVLHKGYGLAQGKIRNKPETIFGIGSVPIDFTRAAIYLLEQQGKLQLSDTIPRFFPEAPADKHGMTLEHLISGTSGLPNFHHISGVDRDHDLTWIDRQTAVRRILSRELLFAPGESTAWSHSAFGLLTVIVEKASAMSYEDFLRRYFFAPAGMTRTGFYGSNLGYGDQEFAVGQGESQVGKINAPPYWGKTSWLVMGSGGMFSTTGDMYRWVQAVYEGDILSGASLEKYRRPGIVAGGSDRGFLFLYTPGFANMVFVASNVFGTGHGARGIADGLANLVRGE